MGKDSKVTLKIPKELYDKIEEKISGTSFSSVEEYVVNKLESEFPTEPVYTKEEEELIRERLRKLGYIE
ncbi:MAG: CopG family transcriptional regulator [Candidatus Bathyarchaeota archaeon]|jgi:hypothetical protein